MSAKVTSLPAIFLFSPREANELIKPSSCNQSASTSVAFTLLRDEGWDSGELARSCFITIRCDQSICRRCFPKKGTHHRPRENFASSPDLRRKVSNCLENLLMTFFASIHVTLHVLGTKRKMLMWQNTHEYLNWNSANLKRCLLKYLCRRRQCCLIKKSKTIKLCCYLINQKFWFILDIYSIFE